MKLIKNTPKIWIKKFPWKKKSSNKYSRGRVLILGGQKHMIGATILSAEACLRVGVGSVKIICTKETIKTLSLKFPSVLKVEINNISYLKSFLKKERKTTSVALVGPGAGSNSKTMKFTEEILKQIKYVILDADALNSFQHKTKKLLKYLDKFKLITPHKKEFHRLFPSIKTNLEDKEKVLTNAQNIQIPKDQEILHSIEQHYTIDGQTGIREPIGMAGARLEANVHIITTSSTAKRNLTKCINNSLLEIDDYVSQPVASSEAVLSNEERDLGVCLIDIGCGTTDIAIFTEGTIKHTAVIPIGSQMITNDIRIILCTSLDAAEEIKIQYGCVSSDNNLSLIHI